MSVPRASVLCVVLLSTACASRTAQADDDQVEFDRPGLAFATSTLQPGAFAWEQGLPDVTTDRSAGIRSTEYLADTTLRFGLVDSLELQIEHDSLVHVTTRGGGLHDSATGSGNTTAGLLWTLPGGGEVFEWSDARHRDRRARGANRSVRTMRRAISA